jgi:hypothetical protein
MYLMAVIEQGLYDVRHPNSQQACTLIIHFPRATRYENEKETMYHKWFWVKQSTWAKPIGIGGIPGCIQSSWERRPAQIEEKVWMDAGNDTE